MDNFPVPHFLTSNTSTTSTSTNNSSSVVQSTQPKLMATTSATHDGSHNSIYEPCMSFWPSSTTASLTTTNATTNATTPDQYCYPAPRYFPHHDQGLQFPGGVCPGGAGRHRSGFGYRPRVVAGQSSVGAVLVGVSEEQERRLLDAWTTKVARSKRRLARQRSLNLITRNCFPSSSSIATHGASSATTLCDSRELPISGAGTRDLYTFCTPDKKRLRVLLKKELKNSDVGSLGRIVLPKREAEEKLPTLSDKEGIQVVMRDIYSNREWSLRYKYWSNNKSRMYVLENTGDFVKQNGLEIGDSITLYEDECKNLGARPAPEPSCKRHLITNQNTTLPDDKYVNSSNSTTNDDVYDNSNNIISKTAHYDSSSSLSYASYYSYELARDEEDASLALLIEQLNHKEQQEANSLVTTLSSHIEYGTTTNASSYSYGHSNESRTTSSNYYGVVSGGGMSYTQSTTTIEAVQQTPPSSSSSSSSLSRVEVHEGEDHLDDFFGGLGTLPEVDGQYEYYNYATLFDRIMSDN
ncbi:B3 DNA binding domain containing protein [Trema orientale]|uniref:B3 DNA binding domain containing protein n=1 Tax=Trema orientale TaxID=63057 RepID=A0A2P5CK19_TREOI|nr:B3 DNA binding domain containing protein [Trema orientale]